MSKSAFRPHAFVPRLGKDREGFGAKQAFAHEVEINNLVARFLSGGGMPQPPVKSLYADMTTFPATLQDAMSSLRRSQSVISRLPASVRMAFERDPVGVYDAFLRAQAKGSGASGAGSGPSGSAAAGAGAAAVAVPAGASAPSGAPSGAPGGQGGSPPTPPTK